MKIKEKPSTVFLNILKTSCLFYTPFSIIINSICSLAANGQLLNLWANCLFFGISFIVSLFFVLKHKNLLKYKILEFIVTIYTLISFIINTFVFIINDGSMWDIKSIFLIFGYSVIISSLIRFVNLKNYLISSIIYYTVSLAAFLTITLAIAKYNTGNNAMIFFGSFTVVYVILAIIYFFIKRTFTKFENEEKVYKRQFD